jgi:hypothetical protein
VLRLPAQQCGKFMGVAIASTASVSKERRLYHIFEAFHYGQGIIAVGCDKRAIKATGIALYVGAQ